MESNQTKWVRLGDYIEKCDERNSELIFNEDDVRGVNNEATFCNTKAKLEGINFRPYKIVHRGDFVYNPARLDIGSLAYRNECDCIVSTLYVVFRIRHEKEKELDPIFLLMYFNRDEFCRYIEYSNWGSAREYFWYDDMEELLIPLPSIKKQRAIVDVWKSLRKIKEENEALATPLLQICQSFLQDCKKKYPKIPIGPYIQEVDERNSDLSIHNSQGVANSKIFQTPKQVAANSKADKIVRTGEFAYNRATTRNGEKISIAYREGPDCTVSSAYGVFKIISPSQLDPYFLWMWYRRPEFDRYARYMSKGSAHEFFEFDEMCRVRIPLPDIDTQHSIVSLYQCALEYKAIAAEADKLSRDLCPALMQQVING